ncbi:MAG: hypothetical protein HY513_02650 [Candidatus Aenigmarchaeota archaeon]|nr:hypothetical protein [Candidatus Aenigmarchaeota archaeon]
MKAIKKIPGGKMLAVEWKIRKDASNHTGIITFFELSGDFFAYPEWCIEEIERAVVGTKVSDLKETIQKKLRANNFEIVGFSADDVQRIVAGDLA